MCRDQQRLAIALTIEVLGRLARIGSGGEREIEGVVVDDRLVQLVERQHRHGRIRLEQLLHLILEQGADDHVGPFLNRLLVEIPHRLALGIVEVQGELALIFLVGHQHAVADGGALGFQVAGERQEDGDLLQRTVVRDSEIPKAGRHVALGRVVREALLPAGKLAGQLARLCPEFVHQRSKTQPAGGHIGSWLLFERLQGGGGHAFQQ